MNISLSAFAPENLCCSIHVHLFFFLELDSGDHGGGRDFQDKNMKKAPSQGSSDPNIETKKPTKNISLFIFALAWLTTMLLLVLSMLP